MTAKRFPRFVQSWNRQDGAYVFDKQSPRKYQMIWECMDMMNELHEEKQHLQRRCGAMQEEIEILSEENKQLKQDKDDLIDLIKKEFPKSHKHILGDLE